MCLLWRYKYVCRLAGSYLACRDGHVQRSFHVCMQQVLSLDTRRADLLCRTVSAERLLRHHTVDRSQLFQTPPCLPAPYACSRYRALPICVRRLSKAGRILETLAEEAFENRWLVAGLFACGSTYIYSVRYVRTVYTSFSQAPQFPPAACYVDPQAPFLLLSLFDSAAFFRSGRRGAVLRAIRPLHKICPREARLRGQQV